MATTMCRTCHAALPIAIGLCRRCGLKAAQAERDRQHRAERRQRAAERFARLRQMEATRWQAPATPPEPEATE